MANLGKVVAAAGGVIVAVFSLVGMIVILAEDMGTGSGVAALKVNAVFQGLIMVALGGCLVAGSLLMYDKASKCLGGLAAAIILLASSLSGGLLGKATNLDFYVMLGGLVGLVGAHWNCCCKIECKPAETSAAPAAPAPGPESKP